MGEDLFWALRGGGGGESFSVVLAWNGFSADNVLDAAVVDAVGRLLDCAMHG
jgi:hypothetical protein